MGPWRGAAIVSAVILSASTGAAAGRQAQPAPQRATPRPAAPPPAAPVAAAAPAGPVALAAPSAPPFNTALPANHEFIRRMRGAIRFDDDLQQAYTYLERRRDVKVTGLGKLTVGPQRTFEVYPSNQPGRTYKRLIAVDGKPLPPADLARRDEEHRRNVLAEVGPRQGRDPGGPQRPAGQGSAGAPRARRDRQRRVRHLRGDRHRPRHDRRPAGPRSSGSPRARTSRRGRARAAT